MLNFHRKRQPVADFETANLAVVNATDVPEEAIDFFSSKPANPMGG